MGVVWCGPAGAPSARWWCHSRQGGAVTADKVALSLPTRWRCHCRQGGAVTADKVALSLPTKWHCHCRQSGTVTADKVVLSLGIVALAVSPLERFDITAGKVVPTVQERWCKVVQARWCKVVQANKMTCYMLYVSADLYGFSRNI